MERPLIDIGKAAELYNERYARLGRDIKTVGWGSEESQALRFDVLFRGLDPKGKTVLDVGCGLGDLIPYLEQRTGGDFAYIGIDVADKLVEAASNNYQGENYRFMCGEVFSPELPTVDISVLSGALSFNVDGMEAYAHDVMNHMFALSRECASLNFLTKYVDFEVDKNQHYQPETVFSWAKMLSDKVNLIHDYPLYEFTVHILR
jgi:SAM-dependent methyltransferase